MSDDYHFHQEYGLSKFDLFVKVFSDQNLERKRLNDAIIEIRNQIILIDMLENCLRDIIQLLMFYKEILVDDH